MRKEMRRIRVVVCDDEKPARADLCYILEDMPEVEIVGRCAGGAEVLALLDEDVDVDIVFLDVEMPGMTGLETAAEIGRRGTAVRIVFATGFSQFAVQAFELEAFDYILKPYSDERVKNTIRRYADAAAERDAHRKEGEIVFPRKKLALAANDRILFLDPAAEVTLVKAEKGSATFFYTARGIIESHIALKDAEKLLMPAGFCRTHRNYLVNLNKIKEMQPWFNDTFLLIMEGFEKEQIPISRHYLPEFKRLMGIL